MSFSGTLEAIRQMSAKWPQATRKLVEDKANGTAVIDTLKSEIAGLIPVEPQGGKEARAHAVSAFVEAHNVYLPADAPWVAGFIEGAAQFPNGAHDDQVDGMTQALNFLRGDGYWFFDLELMGNLWGVAKTTARALVPERSVEHDAPESGVAAGATPEGIFKRQADAQMQVSIQADSRIAAVFGQNRKPVAAVKDTVKASSASTPACPQCGAFLSRRETPRGEKVETCNPCGWSNVIPPIVTERFDGRISNS
jgi:predicted phage terminase large subunit-like protein